MNTFSRHASLALVLVCSACSGLPDDRFDTVGADGRIHAQVKPDALKNLRWIEGTWRGVGEGKTTAEPFFERYVFIDDTTLIVDSYTDETLEKLKNRVPYLLRGDSITSPSGFASKVAADSVTFSVRDVETTQITWRRNADSTWTAVATSLDGDSKRDYWYYRMTRVKEKPAPPKGR
jgi:hypothetical protein